MSDRPPRAAPRTSRRSPPRGRGSLPTLPQRSAFLDHLVATCDVSAAAALAGIDPIQVHALRRADPGFQARWRDAIAQSYDSLEIRLMACAMGTDAGTTEGKAAIDTDLALRLLNGHRSAAPARGPRSPPPRAIATQEETDKMLLKQIAAVRKRLSGHGS